MHLSNIAISFFYRIKKSIRSLWVEDFVAVHDGHEVFGVAQIDDVVGVAREHDDGLDLVARYFIVENLGIRVGFVSQLNEAVTGNDSEVLELAVMPVLALGDSRLGDVDADLTMSEGVEELGEAASGIDIHFVAVYRFLLWEVREIGGHELVAEAALREGNHVDAVLVGCCIGTLVDDVNDLSQCSFVSDWAVAVQVIF